MNNAPKRSLEETSSKHPHQYSGVLSPVSLDCHAAHEIGQDSPRAAKTLCVEGRDEDRRSPLHSVYPVPLSSNDSQADHHIVTQKKDLYVFTMNNLPKRSLEETSSKHPHQDSGVLSKLPSSVSKDPNVPYEIGQDSRATKTLRFEGRDADRRSPLHSVYPMPLSSNDSQADHPIVTENKKESRDLKDNRDIRFENCDMKTEKKDLYVEAKDSQVGKSKKDVVLEIRGDDNNESTRYERDSHNDTNGDSKTENDPLNWKDSREYSVKRYMDSWDTSREVGKEDPDDSTQVNNSIGENKEFAKEDQDSEKWERERKDIPKNKEKSTEREKDQIKRESCDGMEKRVSYIEKDTSEYDDDSLRQTEEEFEPRMIEYQSQTKESSDSANHTDLEEEKRVELSNLVDVSGNEKKVHVHSDTVHSSNLEERPSGFMQKSSSYASTARSHSKQPDLLEMGRLWLNQRNEEVQQAVLKAVKPVIIKEAEKYVEFETKLVAETYKKMEDMVNEELTLRKRMEEMSNQLLMQQMPPPSYYQQQMPPPPTPHYYQPYQQQMPPPPSLPPHYYQHYHQQHYYRPDMTRSSLHHYHQSRMSLQPPTRSPAQSLAHPST